MANPADQSEQWSMTDADFIGVRRHDIPSIKQTALYDFLANRTRDAATLKAEAELAFAAEVRPALDVARLQRAYSRVLLRHGELRAVFRRQGRDLRVYRLEPERFHITTVDARELSRSEIVQEMQRVIMAGFPSLTEPLTRLSVYWCADDAMVLFCRIHHLIADGWSLDVFFRDMMALYLDDRAFPAGEDSAETFEDYVDWEEAFVESADGRQSHQFWRDTILAAAAHVPLPYDRKVDHTQISRCGTTRFVVERDVLQSIDRMASRLSTSRFVILLASFALTIARASGARCVPVGVMASRRLSRARRELIGDLAQVIYVVVEPPAGEPSDDYFARVSNALDLAQAHQDFPIEPVIQELVGEKAIDLQIAGFRQLAFNGWTPQATDPLGFGAFLHDIAGRKFQIAGYSAETVELGKQGCSRDIRLNYSVDADQLQFSLLFNADRFDQGTIDRVAEEYRALLLTTTRPDRR